MDRRLAAAIAAAQAGGAVALRYFRTALAVEYKGDRSPVTRADRECEQRVVEVLRRDFPDYAFVGEEFGEHAGAAGAGDRQRPRWIIDPIDGTKNFIRGIPYFATLIGLEEDGEIVTGVVYAPAVDDLLYAQKSQGAFDRNGRLRVSEIASLRDGLVVFGGIDIFRQAGRWSGFERLVRASGRQRGFGDYFGHTFVARGQAEAMVELDLKPWDMAAIKIVIEEAGGRFTDFTGAATIYGGNAIASNGLVHDEILGMFRAA
ncbi:MAG TPA: inositol monophosphatase family protein [Candidatus Acidoferrales bacterium]|nr:inositol monophosphatase family protein [Candidatus Acidoferrales bacterium]